MKISAVKKFSREDFTGAPDWFGRFLDEINNFSDQMITFTENNIIYEDNIYCQNVQYNFNHGEQVKFLNKLKNKPRGLIAVAADGYAIDAAELQYDNGGQIGITVYFNKPDTYFNLTRTSNQAIPTGADTLVSLQLKSNSIGNGLDWAIVTPTAISCNIPGRYLFCYNLAFAGNAVGYRASWLIKNGINSGTLSRFGFYSLPNNGATIWNISGSHVFDLKVNDYVEMLCFQNSGGNLDVLSNATQEVNLTVKKLEYSPANVPCKIYILG